jgi:CheY-like chemotaxis protein
MPTPVRVLVVDDHPDAADTLAAVLASAGCEVRACYTGKAGLAAAAEFRPHVAFIDLLMPGMDGAAVALGLQALPTPPRLLVCVSGVGEGKAAGRTGPAGFHLHVSKPADPKDIVTIARGVEPADG